MNALTNVGEIDRTTYIGSSDAAAIIGMSDWGTPLSVYMDKIGKGEPPTEEKLKFFARRKRQEPIVIEQLMLERAVSVVSVNNRYRHPLHPFIAAEIDFEFLVTPECVETCPGIPPELIGTIQNGEIKTSHPWAGAKFGEEGTDEIPIQYASQSMHGMGVTGRDITLYAVMTGFDQFATYVLRRDDETVKALIAKEVNFWHGNVLARVPPEPIDNDDLKILFARVNGRPVELDEATMQTWERFQSVKRTKRNAEKEEEELKFVIGFYIAQQWGLSAPSAVEDNAAIYFNGQKVGSWNKQDRAGLDSKALSKAHPKIAAEFQKISYFRVFR